MPRHKGHGSKPEWFTDTGEVRTNTLHSAERQLFVEWSALPRSERQPPTQAALARELGVSEQTIRNWKKDSRLMAQVKGLGQSAVIGSFSDITANMVAIATDPEHKSAVAAARLLFDMADKGEKAVDSVPLADMSDDEMRELMGEMYDIFDSRSSSAAESA